MGGQSGEDLLYTETRAPETSDGERVFTMPMDPVGQDLPATDEFYQADEYEPILKKSIRSLNKRQLEYSWYDENYGYYYYDDEYGYSSSYGEWYGDYYTAYYDWDYGYYTSYSYYGEYGSSSYYDSSWGGS